MASSGTLLSDLADGQQGVPQAQASGDTDLVRKIFADMNMSGTGGNMIMSPNPNTVAPMHMDSAPATSHIIGKDHPSQADFAAAMHTASRMQEGMMMNPGLSGSMPHPGSVSNQWMPQQQQQQHSQENTYIEQKNIYAIIAQHLKTPLIVTILVFLLSLPFLNILMNHYLPSMVRVTGELTTVGLLFKSGLAGLLFWILERFV